MKVAFYIFAATCLINALTAADLSAFDTNIDTENFESNFLNFVAPDDDGVKELPPNLVVPPRRPTTVSTTRGTTTLRPSTSEIPTLVPTSTTTRRPRPPPPSPPRPTTTRRPHPPPPPRPIPPPPPPRPFPPSPLFGKNPQIYNNVADSMGPFAGRLVNMILNKGGRQKTVQKNEILYNIKSAGPKIFEETSSE